MYTCLGSVHCLTLVFPLPFHCCSLPNSCFPLPFRCLSLVFPLPFHCCSLPNSYVSTAVSLPGPCAFHQRVRGQGTAVSTRLTRGVSLGCPQRKAQPVVTNDPAAGLSADQKEKAEMTMVPSPFPRLPLLFPSQPVPCVEEKNGDALGRREACLSLPSGLCTHEKAQESPPFLCGLIAFPPPPPRQAVTGAALFDCIAVSWPTGAGHARNQRDAHPCLLYRRAISSVVQHCSVSSVLRSLMNAKRVANHRR